MSFVAESQRLWLQPLSVEAHLEGYHALNTDERVTRWSYRLPSATLADSETLMRARLPSEKEPWMENYAIMLRPNPADETNKPLVMIGCIGVPRLGPDLQSSEAGYGLHPDYWGSGFATEALQLFVSYYWSSKSKITEGPISIGDEDWHGANDDREGEVQNEVLLAFTEPENTASERVLAKVGFQKGGMFEGVEVKDPHTGVVTSKGFTTWRFDRPKI